MPRNGSHPCGNQKPTGGQPRPEFSCRSFACQPPQKPLAFARIAPHNHLRPSLETERHLWIGKAKRKLSTRCRATGGGMESNEIETGTS
jgi:hypothetical protein